MSIVMVKKLSCFERKQDTINESRERLLSKEDNIVDYLISHSMGSCSTTVYDYFNSQEINWKTNIIFYCDNILYIFYINNKILIFFVII